MEHKEEEEDRRKGKNGERERGNERGPMFVAKGPRGAGPL